MAVVNSLAHATRLSNLASMSFAREVHSSILFWNFVMELLRLA